MIRRLGTDLPIQQPTQTEIEHTLNRTITQQTAPQDAEQTVRSPSANSSGQLAEMRLGATAQQAMLNSQLAIESSIPAEETLSVGSRGPAVENIQRELNDWRATNGLPPIATDGKFGTETETAVKEFQKASGLKPDGMVGPQTKERLLRLENNPDFQKLDPEMKNIIRNNLDSYKDLPDARENLLQLATSGQFSNLTTDGQKSIFAQFVTDPSNSNHLSAIRATMQDMSKMENDPAFAKLDDHTKHFARSAMAKHSSYGFGRESIMDLVQNGQYQKLNPEQQERIMSAIWENPGEVSGSQFIGILDTKGFAGMSDAMKSRVIEMAFKDAGTPSKNIDLSVLLSDPSFVNAPEDEQWAQLNGYAGKSGLES